MTVATTHPETIDERIQRIIDDLLAGRRTLDDVRRSVNALAGLPADNGISADAGVNDAALILAARNGDLSGLIARISKIFTNRNVSLDYYGQGAPPPQVPDAPPAPAGPAGPAPTPTTTPASTSTVNAGSTYQFSGEGLTAYGDEGRTDLSLTVNYPEGTNVGMPVAPTAAAATTTPATTTPAATEAQPAATPTPAAGHAETPDERVQRIVDQIVRGDIGGLEALRRSVDALAGRTFAPSGPEALQNDWYIITAARSGNTADLANRVRAVFGNRGVDLGFYGANAQPPMVGAPGTPTAPAPAAPPSPAAPTPTAPTPATPAAPVDTAAQNSARARLQSTLDTYGLGDLVDWAWTQLQGGVSEDTILLDLRNQPAFRQRFPGLYARQERGLAPISPAEYVAYEQQARQIMRQFGMPEGFFDSHDDFALFIAEDVSVAELYERIQGGFRDVAYAPQAVRDVFAEWFGASGDSALAAFFLDPERATPLLQNMKVDAEIGGAARMAGVRTGFSTARALREHGVTYEAAVQGFGRVRSLDPLYAETVSEFDDFTAEGVGTSAVFGLDPAASRVLERRRQRRLSAFEGGGGAALGQRGVAGLGVEEPGL